MSAPHTSPVSRGRARFGSDKERRAFLLLAQIWPKRAGVVQKYVPGALGQAGEAVRRRPRAHRRQAMQRRGLQLLLVLRRRLLRLRRHARARVAAKGAAAAAAAADNILRRGRGGGRRRQPLLRQLLLPLPALRRA